MRRLLFLFRFLGIREFKGTLRYFISKDDINNWINTLFPWGAPKGDEVTNYGTFGIKKGVIIVHANIEKTYNNYPPAIWLLRIVHEKSYEELDFELMYSRKKKKDCLYISSYINHKNSHNKHPETRKQTAKKRQKRFCNKKLIQQVKNKYNEYAFRLTDKKVEFYFNGLLMIKWRIQIKEPLYIVLTRVNVSFIEIRDL